MIGFRDSDARAARRSARRRHHPVLRQPGRVVDLGRQRSVLRADAARDDGGGRLCDAELQLSASDEQAGALVLERRGVLSPVRRVRVERAAADCHWRPRHHRNRICARPAAWRDARRVVGRARPCDVAASAVARTPHHHRYPPHDVDRARAAVLCVVREPPRPRGVSIFV